MPGINNLPVELMAHILLLWSYVDDDGPWMAATVCHHWRRVVLACPAAWSTVHVSLKKEPERLPPSDPAWCIEEDDFDALPPRGKRRPLELWLRRSDATDLSLQITVEHIRPFIEIELVKVIRTFEPHAPRIRHFALEVEIATLANDLLAFLPPMKLASCEIRVSQARVPKQFRFMDLPDGNEVGNFWAAGLAARSVLFDGCIPAAFSRRQLPLGVGRLEIRNAPARPWQLQGILGICSAVTTLILHNVAAPMFSRTKPDEHSVVLPFLTHLSITNVYMDDCANILCWLHAPALEVFDLTNGGMNELRYLMGGDKTTVEVTAPLGAAFTTFAAHAPRLRTLRIGRTGLHDRHLVAGLRHLRALRELDMHQTVVGAPALRALTLDADRPVLCPTLEWLKFAKCDVLQGEHLIALVASRNDEHAKTLPISEVVIDECAGVSSEHCVELMSLVERCVFLSRPDMPIDEPIA